jgi:NDP-sugar pyrophosphorylase family protein/aminoglycoside/choline kinase family phosphotransferase
MKEIRAFILAAGLGERLRPITYHLPKPLLPILGEPVIERVTKRIFSLPVSRVGINLHHKAGLIRNWAETSRYARDIELFDEESILGTGGALKNAEIFLQECQLFVVHNADILSNIDIEDLIERHLKGRNAATLAIHSRQEFNNVWVDEKGDLCAVGGKEERRKGFRRVAFTGIAAYSPEFLTLLPSGKSSIVDAWLRAAAAGLRVGTLDFTGCRWDDIGTTEAFSAYVFNALKEEGETIFVDPSVDCSGICLGANAVIEKGSFLGEGASLRSCILLPGARADKGSSFENAIVGPDYRIDLKEPLEIPCSLPAGTIEEVLGDSSGGLTMTLVGAGGSERRYYRIRSGERKAILMECPKTDPDYPRHIIYTHFFRKYSVPVPELIRADAGALGPSSLRRGNMYALFEDLGDTSQYTWLKCEKDPARVESLYRRVLDVLISLHTTVTDHVSECLLLQSRIFDYSHLRWETGYFIERFAVGVRGLSPDSAALDPEFGRLARQVDSFPKTIVHRDFQSQNIMITDGDLPRVIDYQGARMGPPAYDLVSILWDPYVPLDDRLRTALLDYYISGVKDLSGGTFNEDAFRDTILPCRLQRHMQALGAYAFLSQVKGRTYFLKYVPQALHYLKEEIEEVKNFYPVLWKCVSGLYEKAED